MVRHVPQPTASRAHPHFRHGSKLHVGCGSRRIAGWVNADVAAGVGDVALDLHDPNALPAATFQTIYGSHVLEHCWPQDTPGILARLHNALLPGGTLRLSVPDLRLVVKNCLDSQVFGDGTAALSVIYGGSFSRTTSAPDLHRQAFWKERLTQLLTAAGFVNVREWGVGQYAEIDALKDWSTWPRDAAGRSSISLNMEADRPGTMKIESSGSDLKLLVRMPTRSRPDQALAVLTKYREMSGVQVALEVVIDEDDASMATPEVHRRLHELYCAVAVGPHKSKIEAVNGGQLKDWDVLLLASDDMVPIVDGYATRILSAMAEHFPQLDGALYFNDNYVGAKLCTLPIFGRRLYEQFGHVYHPEYKSFFCDNEQTEVLQAVKRLVYIDEKLIEHRHYANPAAKAPMDALYKTSGAFWDHDKAIYERRRATKRPYAQAAFDSPPVWLSLLVPTMPSRRELLERLLKILHAQAAAHPREVEILVDPRERVTIGAKRNALLQRSVGRFVASIDDDDLVSDDYVARILEALKKTPDADCAAFCGVMSTDGTGADYFHHSIQYAARRQLPSGAYEGPPEHRNAVRRDLALAVGFPNISFGEDQDFAKRLRPHLKLEAPVGQAPLYFYRYDSNKPPGWYYGSPK